MKIIIAKCTGCGNKKEIWNNKIAKGDHPCCNSCGMPLVAIGVKNYPTKKFNTLLKKTCEEYFDNENIR